MDDDTVSAFRAELYDTELFFDPYAKGKFGAYLLRAHSRSAQDYDAEGARQLAEEASLFVEATHACYQRMASERERQTA